MARFSPTLSLIKQRIPTPLIDFINFIYGAIDLKKICTEQHSTRKIIFMKTGVNILR
jgi:hypothetical protein